ncbi:MAG: hypothetical protein EBZ48_16465, partial [Proteobacteria bacterium]|nr:hypothetical protein [Pseudomonadota bacterium]
MPGKERSQYQIFEYIQHIGTVYGLPKAILQDAIWFYKKAADECHVRGSNRDGMIASSVYMACQRHKYPYTMKEIGEFLRDQSKKVRLISFIDTCHSAGIEQSKKERGAVSRRQKVEVTPRSGQI